MKKRNKKYNPVKNGNRLIHAAIKNLAVVFCGGNDGKSSLVNYKTKIIFIAPMPLAYAIADTRFNWTVICAVFCRDKGGHEYMRTQDIFSPDKHTQEELAETLQGIHARMLDDANPTHICNLGWLAVPRGHDGLAIDDKSLATIFEKAGAWNTLAKWQQAA